MHPVRKWFEKARAIPGGTRVFSWVLGRYIPYTGSIGSRVESLSDGEAVVRLEDRRGVRNHLDSVHAVALANLGEFSTGLAVLGSAPDGSRAILRRLEVDYRKKARGTLVATARVEVPRDPGRHEVWARSEIRDREGEVVTSIDALWVLDIRPRS
ncbi:MAG TPA: DUF4442 domain-containing protein [Myxococcota bacterium]|nr:DUF4442 domain-containing protein [Myxococcota bacterium]HQK49822.1 DUF4442 domain-containing protein [Myxococcota bacterium]